MAHHFQYIFFIAITRLVDWFWDMRDFYFIFTVYVLRCNPTNEHALWICFHIIVSEKIPSIYFLFKQFSFVCHSSGFWQEWSLWWSRLCAFFFSHSMGLFTFSHTRSFIIQLLLLLFFHIFFLAFLTVIHNTAIVCPFYNKRVDYFYWRHVSLGAWRKKASA